MTILRALSALSLRAFFVKQSPTKRFPCAPPPAAPKAGQSRMLFLAAALLVPFSSSYTQSPDGQWIGSISVMGAELNIMVTFVSRGDSVSATIDIPQQMALSLALTNVSWKPPKTHFELPAGPGLAVFDGTIAGDSVRGRFMQGGYEGSFRLERGRDVKKTAAAPAPVPPPYAEDSITYVSGGITIAGTLTVPRGKGRHPAAVLITGSGAHNRDEELFGFRPFQIIADYLTRRGIAVLRCDDRGVGGSGGSKSTSTTADHALDVLAAVKYLRGRDDIDPGGIGLVGHSEGGAIAPIAAAQSQDVAFIVLLAGPSITGAKTILYQLESQLRLAGSPADVIGQQLHLQERVFNCVRADTGWAALAELLRADAAQGIASLPPERRRTIADSASFVNATAQAKIAAVRSPWFRYFVTFDPAKTLASVRCPVLAIFGELDQQVPVALNRGPMEDALRKGMTKDWKIEVIPKANHLFITAVTGAPAEYATLEKRFVPGFLDLVGDWITKRAAVPGGAMK